MLSWDGFLKLRLVPQRQESIDRDGIFSGVQCLGTFLCVALSIIIGV